MESGQFIQKMSDKVFCLCCNLSENSDYDRREENVDTNINDNNVSGFENVGNSSDTHAQYASLAEQHVHAPDI